MKRRENKALMKKVECTHHNAIINKFLSYWSIFYVILLLCNLLLQLKTVDLSYSRDFADLYINYEGGFVRRGLLGQLFWYLYTIGIDPLKAALGLSFVSYGIIACYLIYKFKSNGYELFLLPICFLLGGFSLYEFTFFRRDFMLLCIFLLTILFWKKMSFGKWLLAANILTGIALLCYEPYIFFALPLLCLLTHVRNKNYMTAIICWVPSVLVFLLCCHFSGNENMYDAVWKAVSHFLKSPGTLEFLKMNSKDVMAFHVEHNFLSFYHHIPVALISLVGVLSMVYYCVNAAYAFGKTKMQDRRYMLILLTVVLFCQLPMFVCLSTDYSRICICSAISVCIIYFELTQRELESLFPANVYAMVDKFIIHVDKIIYPSRGKIIFIMMFVGIATWTGHYNFLVKSEFGGAIDILHTLISRICNHF